jgi:hypothetical protein
MAPIPLFDISGPHTSVFCASNRSILPHPQVHPHSRFLQSTFPTLPHGHSWADLFSSPLNPDLFAHLAATGGLGPVASTSSSVPSSFVPPARSQHPFPLLDTYDSQQGHSDTPFNSPSYPSFRDQRNFATSPYHESKSRRPVMADVSLTIPGPAGAKPSGLNDAGRGIHDDIRAHSRRGSAGKVFCRGSALDASDRRTCQGPPSHRPTYQILMQRRLPITIPTPTSQLADQVPVSLHRCGCLLLRPRRSPASIRMPRFTL